MSDEPHPGLEALARIRARLAARIDETGISIARLARRSGVSEGTIHRLLNKPDRDVYIKTLASLARVLGLDIKDLFEPLPPETAAPRRADEPPEGGPG